MTASVDYRIFFDGKPASRDLYDQIETVTVEQGLDMASEARIELAMCMNDRGVWHGRSERYAQPFKRVRIEVRNMSSSWVPLIDGQTMASNANMSGDPSQSALTIVVHDDSVELNREVELIKFEGRSDLQVVRELIKKGPIKD